MHLCKQRRKEPWTQSAALSVSLQGCRGRTCGTGQQPLLHLCKCAERMSCGSDLDRSGCLCKSPAVRSHVTGLEPSVCLCLRTAGGATPRSCSASLAGQQDGATDLFLRSAYYCKFLAESDPRHWPGALSVHIHCLPVLKLAVLSSSVCKVKPTQAHSVDRVCTSGVFTG